MLGRHLIAQDTIVMRVTKEQDVTQKSTIRELMTKINRHVEQGYKVHLHCSTPCTGGSALQHINLARGMDPKRIQDYELEAQRMLQHFSSLARMVVACSGTISVEWPRNCTYWDKGWFLRIRRQCCLQSVEFDGCMLGSSPNSEGHTVGIAGCRHLRHRKPWRIDTNNHEILKAFEGLRCCQDSRFHTHVPIEGQYTQKSEVGCIAHGVDPHAEQQLDDAVRLADAMRSWADEHEIWAATAMHYDMTIPEAVEMGIVPEMAMAATLQDEEAPEDRVHNDYESKMAMHLPSVL
eukprot:6472207-Amphidinium_carterae.3